MKTPILTLTLAAGLLCAVSGFAQTAAPAAASTKPTAATTVATPAPVAAPAPAKPAATDAAPSGAGHGQVWVNTKSHVYHCEGSKSYGKTKSGEYMSEADAKTKGNHPDHGKACAKQG